MPARFWSTKCSVKHLATASAYCLKPILQTKSRIAARTRPRRQWPCSIWCEQDPQGLRLGLCSAANSMRRRDLRFLPGRGGWFPVAFFGGEDDAWSGGSGQKSLVAQLHSLDYLYQPSSRRMGMGLFSGSGPEREVAVPTSPSSKSRPARHIYCPSSTTSMAWSSVGPLGRTRALSSSTQAGCGHRDGGRYQRPARRPFRSRRPRSLAKLALADRRCEAHSLDVSQRLLT
jgi:hypothetical protein